MKRISVVRPLARFATLSLTFAAMACSDLPTGTDGVSDPAFAKGGPNQLPTSGGRIFFTSFMTGSYDIYSVSPDGTDMRRLTFSSAHETNPAVSPDGKKVAYHVWTQGGRELWIMNADGSRPRLRLTQPDDALNVYPATWSPDGKTLTFSYQETGTLQFRIASIGVNSGAPVVHPIQGYQPTWSPDGNYLSYIALTPDGEQVVTSRPDGSDLVQRSSATGSCCGYPQFSPDGSRILYQEYLNGALHFRLAAVAANASTVPLAVAPDGSSAAWSADATKIAYSGTDGALRVTLVSGGANVAILEGVHAIFGISWSK
jgi:Tol biopolymer transport system component